MQFDPENNIVQLCAAGMNAEVLGKNEDAVILFRRAWDNASNNFEAFIAAHYLARHQNPENTLTWHLESLNRALLVDDENIKTYLPSLYLNVARSYETLNRQTEAGKYYNAAADSSSHLPPDKYSEMIRGSIGEGLKRTGAHRLQHTVLDQLINSWCEQKHLRPLAMVLPAYIGNLGTPHDIAQLSSALSDLSATRCLEAAEQAQVEQLIAQMN